MRSLKKRLFAALPLALMMTLVSAATLTACKKSDAPPAGPAPQAVAPAAQRGPAAAAPRAPLATTGKVLETMDASSYTYVKLKTADGAEVWVAGPQMKVAVGDELVARDAMEMVDFESTTLGRKFDRILFASRLAKAGEPAPAAGSPHGAMGGGAAGSPHGAMGGGAAGSPHGAMGGGATDPHGGMAGGMAGAMGGGGADVAKKRMAVAKQEIAAVPKAEGDAGRTVAEVHAQIADLAGKPVAVRGTVVKFSPGIMGRNWLHIQDATGDAAQKTHDLTVTTKDAAKPGDRVLILGTAAKDKDFGAGYKYAVIVEDAKVTVEP